MIEFGCNTKWCNTIKVFFCIANDNKFSVPLPLCQIRLRARVCVSFYSINTARHNSIFKGIACEYAWFKPIEIEHDINGNRNNSLQQSVLFAHFVPSSANHCALSVITFTFYWHFSKGIIIAAPHKNQNQQHMKKKKKKKNSTTSTMQGEKNEEKIFKLKFLPGIQVEYFALRGTLR